MTATRIRPGWTSARTASAVLLLEGPDALGSDVRNAFSLEFEKGKVCGHLGHSWTGQLDSEIGDDPAGTGAHDQDPVGEKDRLVDVVRHEHDRRSEIIPDLQQVLL